MCQKKVQKIIIVDFGSQVTQLIARQIRELGVYCELINYKLFNNNQLIESNVKGIVLSGGPKSTLHKSAPSVNKKLINSNIPVLGICYGHQLISNLFGGKTKYSKKKEFGSAELIERKKSKLTFELKILNKVPIACGRIKSSSPIVQTYFPVAIETTFKKFLP